MSGQVGQYTPAQNNTYTLLKQLFAGRQYTSVIKSAKQFLQMNKQHPDNRLFLLIAYSYTALNEPDEAIGYFKMYISSTPEQMVQQKLM